MSESQTDRTEMVREHLYRFRRIPVKQQLFIAKRLGPVLGGFQKAAALPEAERAQVFMATLASIPDDDLTFIMDTTLTFTDRRLVDNSWMPVFNVRAKANSFADLELDAVLEIVLQALGESLGPFLSSLQGIFGAPTQG